MFDGVLKLECVVETPTLAIVRISKVLCFSDKYMGHYYYKVTYLL
jgi:hypothetical protein